jgi:hypothetical protein
LILTSGKQISSKEKGKISSSVIWANKKSDTRLEDIPFVGGFWVQRTARGKALLYGGVFFLRHGGKMSGCGWLLFGTGVLEFRNTLPAMVTLMIVRAFLH